MSSFAATALKKLNSGRQNGKIRKKKNILVTVTVFFLLFKLVVGN